jgi:hypothetical protein
MWFIEDRTHFRLDIECSSFEPPHYLQECTENFPNMKGVVCKTTNSQPKVMSIGYTITLMYLLPNAKTLSTQKHSSILKTCIIKVKQMHYKSRSPCCHHMKLSSNEDSLLEQQIAGGSWFKIKPPEKIVFSV